MMRGIFIVGPNGSGKTTLGALLARQLACRHIDIEDFSFEPSEKPYEKQRPKEQVRALVLEAMQRNPDFVFSAVNGDLGPEGDARCDLVVYLHAPLETRLERVRRRTADALGARACEGGDLHEQEKAFLQFVRSRSMEKTDRWVASRTCPVWQVDATIPAQLLAQQLAERIKDEDGYRKRG